MIPYLRGFENWTIFIVYRIYYKAMTTAIDAKCLVKPKKGMTLLFQANEKHSSVMTPLEIPWASLTHSNTWNFKQISAPKPIKHRKPLYITQDDKGDVVIQFPPKETGQSSRISVQESAQGSTTSSPPRYSLDSRRPPVKLDNVDFAPNIPYPRYVKQEFSPPTSPTPSQMLPPDEPHQLMVIDDITKPFQIDKDYLNKELHLSKHREKREWFFSTKLTTQTRHKFREEWYRSMERNGINIPMFTYLELYASNNSLDYPFGEVNMLHKGQVWKTASKNILANHHLLEEITITTQNMEVIASPFKIINPKDDERRSITLKDCKNLQQQNNFTNQILGTLSSQMDRIEDRLEDHQASRQIVTPHFLDRNLDKNCPIFKPAEVGNHKLKFSNHQ